MCAGIRTRLFLVVLMAAVPCVGVGQPGQPGAGTTLFQLDLSQTPVGELPANIDLVTGILEVALKNGVPMLKASALSEFRITLQPLGQVLPPDFILEFDLVPKLGSNPQDLSVEGTPTINQGDASAHVLWHATGSLAVIGGGGDSYETPMPEDLQATLPGVLTKVRLEVEGPTMRLYTNGRRHYTLQKQFARGPVLRVYLGAQNGGTEAVYLAGLRILGGAGMTIATQQSGMTGGLTSTATLTSGGSVTRSAVVTSQSVGRNSATLGSVVTASSSQLVSSPPAPPPVSNVILAPPVGAGTLRPSSQQQVVGTPGSMRLDNIAFPLLLLKGGSSAGGVVEARLADGSIKKSIGTVAVEPLVFEVGLGSPVEAWLQTMLTGAATFKNGSLFGGVVPAQQQLSFQNGLLTSVTIPALDAASSTPGFLQVTVQPEQTSQSALSSSTSTTLTSWLSSDFRFTMGNLETGRAMRIESFTIAAPSSTPVGGQQIAPFTSAGQPTISNLLLSIAVDATHPAPNWLAWYDDFVLKGNNGDSHEQSFLLELGVGRSGSHRLALKGSGVGLVSLRVLPQPPGSTGQRLQAELYVERMDVVP